MWAHRRLPAKNTLTADDARAVEAACEVVIKYIRTVFELVGIVTKRQPSRHPARRGDNGIVARDHLGIVAVIIRDVDFAVLPPFGFESDLGFGNALDPGDLLHDVIGRPVRLRAERRAGIGFREERGFARAQLALNVGVVVARNRVLRRLRAGHDKAHHFQVEFQRRGHLAGEAAD